MAPGQVPHHIRPWRDAQALHLLSPLMGFLSRAWSLLRGPGPPQPWLVEARIGADELEAGVEGEAEAPPEGPHFLQLQNPEGEAEDSRAPEDDGGAAAGPSLDLKASSSAPKAWGLSCGDGVEYRKEADRQQPGEFTHGQPAPLSPPLLLSALQGPDKSPREEQSEGREAAEQEGETKSAYLSSHCQGGPAGEEQQEDGEAVNKEAATTSASPLAPGLKPSTWLCCPGEEEERATEDRGTENTESRESPISPSWSGSSPGAWQSCSGEAAEKDTKDREGGEKGNTDPEPWSSVPPQGFLLEPYEDQPRKNAEEEEEEEDEDRDSRLAEEEREAGDSSTPTTNAFLRAWVYRPGEDTEEEEEEEDEDSDLGSAEEEREADASFSTLGTSTFLRTWVYRPGEDTEEQEEEEQQQRQPEDGRDLGSAEEGEADASSSTLGTNTFLRAWVYRPGEDTEEEEEEEQQRQPEDGRDLGSAEEGEADASSSTLGTSTFLRAWVYRPGEDTEEEEEQQRQPEDGRDLGSAEEGEADASSSTLGTSTFLRAWVYQPGEDTEEEDEWEENQDTGGDSREADWGPSASLQLQGALPRAWTAPPTGGSREELAAEACAGAEPRPIAVAIYVPGQKPPAPWAAPKLPLRLQRRLRLSETLPQDQDPEAPPKDRKVRFSEKVTVHLLAVWAGPAQAARRGPWEQLARDRSRFAHRIARAQEELGPCFTPAWRARAWARLGNPPYPGPWPRPSTDPGPAPVPARPQARPRP
ncbi:protein phosphatase 1 regulatory subunit 15A [Erethizon dorsatum]